MAIDLTPEHNPDMDTWEHKGAIDVTPEHDSKWTIDPRTGPIRSFLESANDQLYGGFSGEIRGGLDTAVDTLSGNLPDSGHGFLGDVAQSYRNNRNVREADLHHWQEANPGSSLAGSVAGSIPSMPLFGGATAPIRLGKAAGIGGLLGLGSSEADLTQGEFGEAAKDVGTGAAILGTMGLAAEGLSGLSKLLKPKNLDTIAGHNRIAGGGDASKAPTYDAPFLDPKTGKTELPASMKGYQIAKQKGFIDDSAPGLVTNKPQNLKSKFQGLFRSTDEIDYSKLRQDVQNDLIAGHKQKLAMLESIGDRKIPAQEVLGPNATLQEKRIFSAVTDLDKQIQQYGIQVSPEELAGLQAAKKGLGQEHLTLPQMEDLSKNLGILTRKSFGKQFPEGSPQQIIRETKSRIDNRILQELDSVKRNGLAKVFKNNGVEQLAVAQHRGDLRDLDLLNDSTEQYLKNIEKFSGKANLTQNELQTLHNSLKAVNNLEKDTQFTGVAGRFKEAERETERMLALPKKDLGKSYQQLNRDLYNEAEFLDTVKDGEAKLWRQHGMDPRYETDAFSARLNHTSDKGLGSILGSAIGGGIGLGIGGPIGAGVGAGIGAGAGALLGGQASSKLIGGTLKFSGLLSNPKNFQWVPKIFTSYNDKTQKLNAPLDIELHNSYVDQNNQLSPRDKARAKTRANVSGKINTNVIPESVKKSAEDKVLSEDKQIDASSLLNPDRS